MQSGFLLEIVLPISLFIIMFGMGLSLTLKDFERVALFPKAVLVGLLAQLLLLPLLGFMVATMFHLEPLLAVGLMVLSCCPSGPTSNMYSYLFKGDVALSVTLTALISVIKPFTLPFLTYYSMVYFMGEGKTIELPILKTILQLFIITVLPVGIGMVVKNYSPKFATACEKPVKVFSMIILFAIIAGLVKQNWEKMWGFFAQSGVAALTMNCICISLGFLLGLLLRLSRTQAVTIAFELGIQNGTTALLVTGTILQVPTMTVVPITYSLLMFVTALVFGLFILKNRRSILDQPSLERAS
ncbi:bile acid:sodium symporter family protein [Leptospira sp. WS58.C1]|uniref:bile acid:sodium symporter family protein n=1 Tax=Leptospira TaxID=171 RepID=UPI0002BD7F65|nr:MULTISPECIES: bile acid:sodium symporter family protein [unclassified Leptospira]EMK01309.1 sodium Bile acid symporter family protein [Leptospira sp. B5-022]MCR1794456.1 bile acid:sodium symporter family protein [Leptospira sp. id769339]